MAAFNDAKESLRSNVLRVRQTVAAARRAADFRQRYWNDVDLEDAVLIHMADAGHANGARKRQHQAVPVNW